MVALQSFRYDVEPSVPSRGITHMQTIKGEEDERS